MGWQGLTGIDPVYAIPLHNKTSKSVEQFRGYTTAQSGGTTPSARPRLFFANQGAFQTGDYDEIMNKATCLSLLSNAVVVWNTCR